MNLSTLLTTLAFVTATEAKLGGTPSFADQVSFLEKHAVGGQPDYCYPQYEPEDYGCYKEGYPKCCYKSKGNCPNDVKNKPGCECLPGSCGGSGGDTKGDRCTQNDGTCKGSTFCKTTEGTCAGEGRCEEMTISCDRSAKQVCGCNGATYDNECAAFGRGVSVDTCRPCGTDPDYFPGYPVCKRTCRQDRDCQGQGGVFNPCNTCGQYQGTEMYRQCYDATADSCPSSEQ